MARRPLIAAYWKMHTTVNQAQALFYSRKPDLEKLEAIARAMMQ